jgi:CHASE3 domain sensor protein
MKTSKKRLLVLFLSVLVLVACSDIFIYWVGRNALASQQKIAAGTSTRLHLEEMLSNVKDAETGQRGYLLTGQESYLAPYREAAARFESELNELRRLSAASKLPFERVDTIGRLYEPLFFTKIDPERESN